MEHFLKKGEVGSGTVSKKNAGNEAELRRHVRDELFESRLKV